MAKLTCIGRLGSVATRGNANDYLSFGVAEPSYKKDNDYVTPWFNFLIKADSPIAKFLSTNADKIDVVEVIANERESKKDNVTTYFHNVSQVNVITWKKKSDGSDDVPATGSGNGDGAYPWSQNQ